MASMILNLTKVVKEQKMTRTKIYRSTLEVYVEVYIEGLIQFIDDMNDSFEYKIEKDQNGQKINTADLTIKQLKSMMSLEFGKNKDK